MPDLGYLRIKFFQAQNTADSLKKEIEYWEKEYSKK